MLGLPYAFASHFAPQMMMEAIAVYRERFEPSAQLAEPHVMLGLNAIVADTDEEAEFLATSHQQAFMSIRSGRVIQLPPPKRGYTEELPLEARAACSRPSPLRRSAAHKPPGTGWRSSSIGRGPMS
jgi:alkanesulfonate monooxygenase SsuD/methylene tetrahydromethanopterin reductase-like flavin-dependent oxidoreductase (luciferase family)